MLAIPICGGFNPARHSRLRLICRFFGSARKSRFLAGVALLLSIATIWADDGGVVPGTTDTAVFAKRAEKVFKAAKERVQSEPGKAEALLDFGRVCYDWADYSTTKIQRAEIANQGIDACKKLIALDAKSVGGHYYLAMNCGQLAQTKTLGALRLVSQMETEFKTALSLDAKFDYAGPDRNLGLLYWQAPGWPTSLGSNAKARTHLTAALKAAPEYPENALNLIEAELKWGDKPGVARDFKTLNENWDTAKKKLTGEEWASSWADWEKRKAAAEKKIPSTDGHR
jgi:hypothetical protein